MERVSGRASDGFLMEVVYADDAAPLAPPGLLPAILEYALDNYEEFLS